MNVDKYNYTFYQGIYILIVLVIISFLTYLFKYDNVKYAINFFILFVILLLTILCSSTFKNNVIENFRGDAGLVDNNNDIDTKNILDITVAIADEPFGRFNLNLFDSGSVSEDDEYRECFKELYKSGYRGFHFYVEYPKNNQDTPVCVFPYKDNNGMNSISTRNRKIDLGTVISAFKTGITDTDMVVTKPVFLCLTCLSPEKENTYHHIETALGSTTDAPAILSLNIQDTFNQSRGNNKLYATLGTYDNTPLSFQGTGYPMHYYIKEYELKYAPFNVANQFGVYAPLINYTKAEQDSFNSTGLDVIIQQSVNLAYINGVQFVCIPPTTNRGNIGLHTVINYDYPTTVNTCKTFFTVNNDVNPVDISPYKMRPLTFLSQMDDIKNDITRINTSVAVNSSKIDRLDSSVSANSTDISDLADKVDSNSSIIITAFKNHGRRGKRTAQGHFTTELDALLVDSEAYEETN